MTQPQVPAPDKRPGKPAGAATPKAKTRRRGGIASWLGRHPDGLLTFLVAVVAFLVAVVAFPLAVFWRPGLLLALAVVCAFYLWLKSIRTSRDALIASGGAQIGKDRAAFRVVVPGKVKTRYADVAGLEESKAELQQTVDLLRNRQKFKRFNAEVPRGVLLIGPPGCGKTLLARAVAGEAGVSFIESSASAFVQLYVGHGAKRVGDLFEEARKRAPCLVFIDEIDAIGGERGGRTTQGHEEYNQTLLQLFVELDGFDERTNIVVIAATNRPDVLDTALIRPGRFDRRVEIAAPDAEERAAIFGLYLKNKPLSFTLGEPAPELVALARRTAGFSGADIKNIVNEAAIQAADEDKEQLTLDGLLAQIDRIMPSEERLASVKAAVLPQITGQAEPVAALADVVNLHYGYLRRVGASTLLPWPKPNALIVGPQGVGKSRLVQLVAEHLGVPFIRVVARSIAESPEPGRALLQQLLNAAGGNTRRAEFGIISIRETQDVISNFSLSSNPAFESLLATFMRGITVNVSDATTPGGRPIQLTTRNILFLLEGTYPGMEKAIEQIENRPALLSTKGLWDEGFSELLQEGFDGDLIEQIAFVISLRNLDREDLASILKSEQGRELTSTAEELLNIRGITTDLTAAPDDMAALAAEKKQGVYGILQVLQELYLTAVNRQLSGKLPLADLLAYLRQDSGSDQTQHKATNRDNRRAATPPPRRGQQQPAGAPPFNLSDVARRMPPELGYLAEERENGGASGLLLLPYRPGTREALTSMVSAVRDQAPSAAFSLPAELRSLATNLHDPMIREETDPSVTGVPPQDAQLDGYLEQVRGSLEQTFGHFPLPPGVAALENVLAARDHDRLDSYRALILGGSIAERYNVWRPDRSQTLELTVLDLLHRARAQIAGVQWDKLRYEFVGAEVGRLPAAHRLLGALRWVEDLLSPPENELLNLAATLLPRIPDHRVGFPESDPPPLAEAIPERQLLGEEIVRLIRRIAETTRGSEHDRCQWSYDEVCLYWPLLKKILDDQVRQSPMPNLGKLILGADYLVRALRVAADVEFLQLSETTASRLLHDLPAQQVIHRWYTCLQSLVALRQTQPAAVLYARMEPPTWSAQTVEAELRRALGSKAEAALPWADHALAQHWIDRIYDFYDPAVEAAREMAEQCCRQLQTRGDLGCLVANDWMVEAARQHCRRAGISYALIVASGVPHPDPWAWAMSDRGTPPP